MEGNLVGLAEDYQAAVEALPGYLSALAERPYPYRGRGESIFGWTGLDPSSEVTKVPYPHDVLHLRVQGAFADNASPSIVPAAIVREWNEKWAYPRLRLATNSEFFSAAEERFGEVIETYSPLLGILSASSAAVNLPERGSFCSVYHPRIDVIALTPSRRGHDLTVMLQSLSSESEEVRVSFGLLPVARAWVGSHLEKDLEEAEVDGENVRFDVPAGSLVSLAVDLERGR